MIITKKAKRGILLYLAAFLFCGITHVMLYRTENNFLKASSQFICGILLIVWGVTIERRITDSRLRNLILSMEFFLLFYIILQIVRYNFFKENLTMMRYIWYACFIPGIFCPILLFAISLSIQRSKEERLPQIFKILILLGFTILSGILSNDLHFQAYSFPDGILDDAGGEKREWLYFVTYPLKLYSLFLPCRV